MKALLAVLDVDYAQWRALTIAALKLDFRTSSWGARRGSGSARAAAVIIGRVLFYTGLGAGMALVVGVVGDVFVAAMLVMSYVIVMVGTALLVEHNATVISPTDHAILGYLPVSSRTYFAARVTNVLVYTLGATTALGWLPVAAFFVRHGFAVGTAAAIALFACSISVTLAVVAGYLWLVRRLGARRLQSAVSYLQLVTGVLVYGGFFVLPEFVSSATLTSLQLTKTAWLLLYPGAWFASYLSVATGATGFVDVLPVLVSLAVLAFLVIKLRGRLSVEYAEQLAAITTAAAPVSDRASWIFFATPADRTRLVRASTHVLVAFFVLPYLVFVGLTLIWFTASFVHLATYLILAGVLSYVVLLAITCIEPELPFAKPYAKGSGGMRFFGAFVGVAVLGAFLPTLSNALSRSVTATAIAFVFVIALSLLLGRATRARVQGRAALMEFLG